MPLFEVEYLKNDTR